MFGKRRLTVELTQTEASLLVAGKLLLGVGLGVAFSYGFDWLKPYWFVFVSAGLALLLVTGYSVVHLREPKAP
jgi:hypothetical protein